MHRAAYHFILMLSFTPKLGGLNIYFIKIIIAIHTYLTIIAPEVASYFSFLKILYKSCEVTINF